MQKALAILSLLAALALLSAAYRATASAQGLAQQPKISVTAQAGYGDTGAYLIGDWFPVRVTLDNPANGASLRVRVQVESKGPDDSVTAGLYARDLDLPASSHKETTLYAFSSGFTTRLTVNVMDGSSVVASVVANVNPYEPPSNVIMGVASSDASLLNLLKGEQVGHVVNDLAGGGNNVYGFYPPPGSQGAPGAAGQVTIAHIKPTDIPALSQALDSLGAFVLDDVDTGSLSPDQTAALEAWVSRGGTLLAIARPGGADITTNSTIAGLLPVAVNGTRQVASLSSLSDLVGTSPLSGTATISVATLRPETTSTARVLAQQDGTPLIVERDLGLGHVVYMGISPGVAPLKTWDGTLPLLKRLLADHSLRLTYGDYLRFSPSRGYFSSSIFGTSDGMFAIPNLNLPDGLIVGFFLFIYIIVVGPVNFIILRRMRRTELAWLTVPALVLVFSVGAYLLAFQSKGGDVIAIRANAVNTYPDVDQATFAQHFGLFSPTRNTYSLNIPADSLVTELNPSGYYQGGNGAVSPVLGGSTTTISDVNIDTWSLKAYVAEHTGVAQFPVETHLNLGDNVIAGTIKNHSTGPLQDVALIRGSAVRYVGYLAPGQQVDVRLDVSAAAFNNASPAGLIPPPAGVSPPQPGLGYPYGGQNNSSQQRAYDRKVELLGAGLYPLLAAQPPTDMSVIVLAWGPAPPTDFDVPGHSADNEELNLWTTLEPVAASGNDQPALPSGSVPYTVYAPGNSPTLLIWNGGRILSSSTVPVPTAVPTLAPGVQPSFVTPTPAFGPPPALPVSPQNIDISPYADVQYRLPAGIKPDKLTLDYSIGQAAADASVDLLAYNIASGTWDKFGTIPFGGTAKTAGIQINIDLPDPAKYTGPAGDVTIRLQPEGKDATLNAATLSMGLNQK